MVCGGASAGQHHVADAVDDPDGDAVSDADADRRSTWSADVADRRVSVVLTALTVVGCVYAAGKIFRTGLLMQGKAATIGEMWRWVKAG